MNTSRAVYPKRQFLTGPVADYSQIAWEMDDVVLELTIDSYRYELYRYEEADAGASTVFARESADFIRARLWELEEVQRKKIELCDRNAGDSSVPAWNERKQRNYDRLSELKAFLKSEWPIDRFLTELMLIELNPAGGDTLVGLCPFHDDRNPSMKVSTKWNRFKCWSCEAQGDIFDFIEMRYGIEDFRQQLNMLADATPSLPPALKTPSVRNIDDRAKARRPGGYRIVGGQVIAS